MNSPKPDWLRVKGYRTEANQFVAETIKSLNLNTVCREALCPNCQDCFARKTATFMILGAQCTRNCSFCNVSHDSNPQEPSPDEPSNVALAVQRLGLRYVVVTSVTRDDLPDGGASHFADTIFAIRSLVPQTAIETLIPDFQGIDLALKAVADAAPTVISHNIETVSSLYESVRPQADYRRSLRVIEGIRRHNPAVRSKSGVMVGLGETMPEMLALFDDLLDAGCEFLTIGQYLAPSKRHIPVKEYVEPSRFDEYADIARQKGFAYVASAPLVRSSYHADEALQDCFT